MSVTHSSKPPESEASVKFKDRQTTSNSNSQQTVLNRQLRKQLTSPYLIYQNKKSPSISYIYCIYMLTQYTSIYKKNSKVHSHYNTHWGTISTKRNKHYIYKWHETRFRERNSIHNITQEIDWKFVWRNPNTYHHSWEYLERRAHLLSAGIYTRGFKHPSDQKVEPSIKQWALKRYQINERFPQPKFKYCLFADSDTE